MITQIFTVMKKYRFSWEAEEFILTEEDLTKFTNHDIRKKTKKGNNMSMSLEARIIAAYTEARKKVMRDPVNMKQIRDRNYAHRLETILSKRYNRPWYEFSESMSGMKFLKDS